mgnify:FL=1
MKSNPLFSILYSLFFALILLLAACGGKHGEVVIRGAYANLRAADFFIYAPDCGSTKIDTRHVVNGRFEYRAPLSESATYRIIYPHMGELAVFASSGDIIEIEGDASNLREVQVSGNDDNETYTELRMQMNQMSDQRVRDSLILKFIAANPVSPISHYLTEEYHKNGASQPVIRKGARMPSFAPVDSMRGYPTIVAFYHQWRHDNHGVLRRLRERLRQDKTDSLRVVTISLNVGAAEQERALERDSVLDKKYSKRWRDTCDFRGLQSPVVQRWQIFDYPYFISIDTAGVIRYCGTVWEDVP